MEVEVVLFSLSVPTFNNEVWKPASIKIALVGLLFPKVANSKALRQTSIVKVAVILFPLSALMFEKRIWKPVLVRSKPTA